MKKTKLVKIIVTCAMSLLFCLNSTEVYGYSEESKKSISENLVEYPGNQGITIEPRYTSSYYYWAQIGSSKYVKTETVGEWINKGGPIRISQNGVKNSQTVMYTQANVSVNISIPGKIVAGGISISPGGSRKILSTYTSKALTIGNYQPQYRKVRNVYNVVQGYYYCDFGNTQLIKKKTGQIKVATDATWRWVKV